MQGGSIYPQRSSACPAMYPLLHSPNVALPLDNRLINRLVALLDSVGFRSCKGRHTHTLQVSVEPLGHSLYPPPRGLGTRSVSSLPCSALAACPATIESLSSQLSSRRPNLPLHTSGPIIYTLPPQLIENTVLLEPWHLTSWSRPPPRGRPRSR